MNELCQALKSFYESKGWFCDVIPITEDIKNAYTTDYVIISPIRSRRIMVDSNQGLPRKKEFEVVITYTVPRIYENDSSGYLNWLETIENVVIDEMLGYATVQNVVGDIESIEPVYNTEDKEKDLWVVEITLRGTLSSTCAVEIKM